ncbi:aquaporin AQPAe.a isoform X2 [Cylas formicarius]|nr:aquaporin AQPAe.a isoform X2 [Cylas formicarius]
MSKFKEVLGINDVSSASNINALWRALLAEFLGNFLLNFFGCGSVVVVTKTLGGADLVMVPFCFGLVVFIVVQSLGHVSGAHINPAVTFAMMTVRRVPLIKGLLYVVVQCAGSLAGSATLMALTPEEWHDLGLGITTVNPVLKPVQGFGIEFFLGFLLVLVVCGVCDPNRPDAKAAGPLAIGLAVTLGHLGLIKYTGASMNPARSFGSAVVAGVWTDHWIYWIGPSLGGIAAALVYVNALTAPPLGPVKIIERYTNVRDEKE